MSKRSPRQRARWPVSALAALGALTLWAADAAAKPRKPGLSGKRSGAAAVEPRERAKQLLHAGQTALAAQDLTAAAQSLFGAYRLAPSVSTLFPLGQLALAQGRVVEAQDLMRRFRHDTAEPEQSPSVREAQRVLSLPPPPSGEVNITGERNAVVLIDDRPVGVLPLPLPLLLPPGEHRMVVERGALRLEDGVTVLAGRTLELRCQFHPGVMVVTIPPALLLLADAPELAGKPAELLEREVARAAGQVRLAVLKQGDAVLQAPKPAACLSTLRCRIELMTQNLVQNALALRATRTPGRTSDWQLSGTVLDAKVGEVAVELRKECAACTADRAAERLAQLAAEALQQGLGRPYGMLELDSTPTGAEVTSGERSIGVTPVRRIYFAGALPLTFKHAGFRTRSISVTIGQGQTTSLKLDLEPATELTPPSQLKTRTGVPPRPR